MANERIAFRPTELQLEALELHRWEGEPMQRAINRLLLRLARARVEQRPLEKGEVGGRRVKGKVLYFRPDDGVLTMLEQMNPSPQAAVDEALSWAISLRPTLPIEGSGDALALLKTMPAGRVSVSEAIAFLSEYCTREVAKKLISELSHSKKIELICNNDGRNRVSIIDDTKKQYTHLVVC